MRFTLRDAHIVDAATDIARGSVTIADTRIEAVEGPAYPAAGRGRDVDASGMPVLPGFVDVHTHGGGGYNLHTTASDEWRQRLVDL